MRIREDYCLSKVGDCHVVVYIGEDRKKNQTMINLNESGAFLWNVLENGADINTLVVELMKEYEVNNEKATKGVKNFINQLNKIDCLI